MLILKMILSERLDRKTIEVSFGIHLPSKPSGVMKQAALPAESEHFRDSVPLVGLLL